MARIDSQVSCGTEGDSGAVERTRASARAFAILFIVLWITARGASAACPTIPLLTPSPQRWSFDTLEWNYFGGGLSTSAISAGASTWNTRQSFTWVQASTGWNDIAISDDTGVTGLAETQSFNHGNGGSPCYLKRSVCGFCNNTSRIYHSEMRLNNNNIGGAASDWASYWGLTQQQAVDFLVKGVVAHEIGHIFWLNNYNSSQNCTDPTIMSINDLMYCALSAPTVCDGNAVGNVYSGWSTVSENPCVECTSTSCSN
jgi:hypothetical protein